MRILADNDIAGPVAVIRRVLESASWAEYSALVGLQFIDFDQLHLARDASDETVWRACQAAGAVLITANRAGGADSLDQVIRRLADAQSLPVVTIADPQRLLRDPSYAEASALQLLDYLDRIESLRGTGRLFVP